MDAVVLAGGVTKGAFEAGALAVLVRAGLRVRRIVGTSAGALNAAFLARAVRAGDEVDAGEKLARLWIEDGTLSGAFDLSFGALLRGEGVSDSAKIRALLREHVRPSEERHRVDLRLVTTSLLGAPRPISRERCATTFEHVIHFDGSVFNDDSTLSTLYEGVAASAAIPGAFAPVHLCVDGHSVPCVDGGAVNETPIKHALEGAPEVDRIFVIVPYPALYDAPTSRPSGVALAVHLVEILIQERLYRDLRAAHATNDALARLEHEGPETRRRVLAALRWEDRRRVEIVEIRPSSPLEGGAFDGLLSRELRARYVAAGREAALGWLGGAPTDRAA